MAAHWEAMMVLLHDDLAAGRLLGRHTHDKQAAHLAMFAAAAVEMVPLLATDPRLAQVLKMCFAVLMEVGGCVGLGGAVVGTRLGLLWLFLPELCTQLVGQQARNNVCRPPYPSGCTCASCLLLA